MKKALLPVILMFLAGCDYEVPLSKTAAAPANAALTGKWTGESFEGKKAVLEIKTSGADYSVNYSEGSDTLTFQGFEVKAAGLNMIQLALENNEDAKYLLVKYSLTPEGLSVYRLNTAVVSAKCQTTEELLSDLTVHRQNRVLFTEPLKFTKSVLQ